MACAQSTTAINTRIVPELLEFIHPDDWSISSTAETRAYNILTAREQDEVDLMLTLESEGIPCWNCMKVTATFTCAALPFCTESCADEYLSAIDAEPRSDLDEGDEWDYEEAV